MADLVEIDIDGNQIRAETFDDGTNEWVVETANGVTRRAADPVEVARMTRQRRRQRRADRLEAAKQSLAGPLGDMTATELRQQLQALRVVVRDLVDEDA